MEELDRRQAHNNNEIRVGAFCFTVTTDTEVVVE